MRITNFMACQYAALDSDNKATLVGAGIDGISVSQFPMTFTFYLFTHIAADLNDVPGKKKAILKLVGEDREIGTREVEFTTSEEKPKHKIISKITFSVDSPGKFRFTLSIDGENQIASWPLSVTPA